MVGYEGGAVFIRTCPECNRFVKADDSITVNEFTGRLHPTETNGTCAVHGKVRMLFQGFY